MISFISYLNWYKNNFLFILFKYSWFKLCYFLLYSKMIQLYIHIIFHKE